MANVGDKYIIEIKNIIRKNGATICTAGKDERFFFDEKMLEGLEPFAVKNNTEDVPEVIGGFAELARSLAAGAKIKAGQKVDCESPDGKKTEWVVIETRPEVCGEGKVIVAQRTVNRYDAFSDVNKEYPYGSNDYQVSKARNILKREYPKMIKTEDLAVVEPRSLFVGSEEKDLFWLLGEEEVDGATAYEWYLNEEHRQMTDWEGDECSWFLRGPYPSYAGGVRVVYTSGALSSNGAGNALGFVAACTICYQNISHA